MNSKEKELIILTQRIKCDPKETDKLKEELESKDYDAIVLPYGIEKVYEDNL